MYVEQIECFVCGLKVDKEPFPIGWELVVHTYRCPRHRTDEKRLASIGDIIANRKRK